jgi:hypothetical protein
VVVTGWNEKRSNQQNKPTKQTSEQYHVVSAYVDASPCTRCLGLAFLDLNNLRSPVRAFRRLNSACSGRHAFMRIFGTQPTITSPRRVQRWADSLRPHLLRCSATPPRPCAMSNDTRGLCGPSTFLALHPTASAPSSAPKAQCSPMRNVRLANALRWPHQRAVFDTPIRSVGCAKAPCSMHQRASPAAPTRHARRANAPRSMPQCALPAAPTRHARRANAPVPLRQCATFDAPMRPPRCANVLHSIH